MRLYPVGRLDIDTTGLILLTNDGELAHRLTHPSFEVEKTYRAVVGGPPVRERALRALRDGVELDDGRTAPARVRRVAADTIELTIHEGRKRQVRRMCEAVGHPVKRARAGRVRPADARRPAGRGAHRRLSAPARSSALSAAGRCSSSSSFAQVRRRQRARDLGGRQRDRPRATSRMTVNWRRARADTARKPGIG